MSKASEWAHGAAYHIQQQPTFRDGMPHGGYASVRVDKVGEVWLTLHDDPIEMRIRGPVAVALARWILATFDDAPGAEPPRP